MSVSGLKTTTVMEPAGPRAGGADLDRALEIFLSQRPQLRRIACRVIGDVVGAEDVVQEAWVRWQRTDRATIKNPAAFLTTTTTRLAINVIQSARHRHEASAESPMGSLVDPAQDPTLRAERGADVEESLDLLMARLAPSELAAYLLRKGFECPYADIAGLLRTSVANARQLVRRAQLRIGGERVRAVDPDAHRLLVTAFLTVARTGDLDGLKWVLAENLRNSTTASPLTPANRPTGRGPLVSSRAA